MANRKIKNEDTYFRVMNLLGDNPDLTQREVAERLEISIGGVNYCLKALIAKGLIKMDNFGKSKNKFGYIYLLTPKGLIEKSRISSHFIARKIKEYKMLRKQIESINDLLK